MKLDFRSRNLLLFVSLCGYLLGIYWLTGNKGWNQVLTAQAGAAFHWGVLLFGQFLLWILNFGLESIRWHLFFARNHTQHWSNSIRSTFVANALGSITPGRLGEHAGRVIMSPKGSGSSAFSVSMLSSTMMAASIVLLAFLTSPFVWISEVEWMRSLFGLGIFLLALMALVFWIVLRSRTLRLRRWFGPLQRVWLTLEFSDRLVLFVLTFLRIFIFGLQLALMLLFWNGLDNAFALVALIPVYFLGVTLVPSIFLADLGIKGSIGMAIFSLSGCSMEAIVVAQFLLWILNTLLPSFIGYAILLQHRASIKTC